MRVLIVGCGYVGRRAAAKWHSRGDSVCALTRSPQRGEELAAAGVTPIIGDVMQPETLVELPTADLVLYAVGLDRSAGYSQREVYVEGLKNVLAAIKGKCPRLIYLSSTSVYGQTAGEWVDEESPCQPTRSSGQVCLEAERTLLSTAESGELSAHILRLSGIYGPGRLLARLEALRSGEPLAGNPEGFLNLIHVDDIVRAIFACEQRGAANQTYLISDDRPITRRVYYETLAKLVEAPKPQFDGRSSERHDAGSLNKRCRNRRMRDQLEVELAYPTIETGLPAALGAES